MIYGEVTRCSASGAGTYVAISLNEQKLKRRALCGELPSPNFSEFLLPLN